MNSIFLNSLQKYLWSDLGKFEAFYNAEKEYQLSTLIVIACTSGLNA